MEKSLKRLLAVALSLMLMFTMGTTVFAANDVAADPTDEAVVLDEGAAVEGEDATIEDEETSIEEVTVKAAEGEALEQVLEAIGELSNDPRDFTAADIERVEAIQAAYDALSAEDQATVDSTFDHPSGDGQSYGRVLEAAVWAVRAYETDTSTTLNPGIYTATTDPAVSSQSNKGKSDSSRTRNWWVESVEVSADGQATAYIYVTSGAATAAKLTSYPSVWTGGETIERNSDNNYPIPVDLNGVTYFGGISSSMSRPIMYELNTTIEEPVGPIKLNITNNTGMFKAVSAYLTTENEQEYLVMALSGTGYTELFKGTYEQAVDNGDGTLDPGNDTWIHSYTNDEGKLEFRIPMEADETYVPVVSVSKSYYDKYKKGENPLERAFYPRQFTLDREAKTLVTGDYEQTVSLTIDNRVKMFKPGNTANIHIVGGPNSNNYSAKLTLNMGSDSYTKVKTKEYTNYAGTITENGEVEIELGENNVFPDIPVLPNISLKLQFFSEKNQTYYDRYLWIDLLNKTATFTATDFSKAEIGAIADVKYTGNAIMPKIDVTLDDETLVEDTDYTVEYANNVNAGTAKVTVKGIGNYFGEKTAEFTINPASQKLTMSTKMKTVKYKKVKKKAQYTTKVAVSGAKTTVTYSKVSGSKKLTIDKKTGKIKVAKKTKKGTYKIKVKATAAKTANYNGATVTKTIKVKVKK